MPFKNKAKAIRAYEYGCLPPTEGRDIAFREMATRLDFWNSLVALERDFAADVATVVAAFLPADKGWKIGLTKDQYWSVIKDATAKAKERFRELEAIYFETASYMRRYDSRLYWGNYNDVFNSWIKARNAIWHPSKKQLAARQGAMPELQMHQLADHMKLSVQWQGGLPAAEVFGDDTLLRIAPVDMAALCSPIRGERRRAARTTAQFCIRTDERHKPVWLTLPLVMHRPLPPNTIVKTASIQCRRVGTHERWSLVISVEAPAPMPEHVVEVAMRPRCSVHLGWQRVNHGVRVATVADTAGDTSTLVLPSLYFSGMTAVDKLQSNRTLQFNAARALLAQWLKATRDVPEWLRERTGTIALWKSKPKLLQLIRDWNARECPDDVADLIDRLRSCGKRMGNPADAVKVWRDEGTVPNHIQAEMAIWAATERWERETESNRREALLLYRREQYRRFAARMANRYSAVALEDMDLAKLALVAGAPKKLPKPIRHQRQVAGLSILRQSVKNACEREGANVEVVDGAYSARTCADCGRLTIRRIEDTQAVYCDWCHNVADREVNTARVLLATAVA